MILELLFRLSIFLLLDYNLADFICPHFSLYSHHVLGASCNLHPKSK